MNYSDPKRCRALAGEYVVGTLHGAARRRFEALCRRPEGAQLQYERRAWETCLEPLNRNLRPLPPPETAWIGLERRIGRRTETVVAMPARARRETFLRTWAWLATAASVVLAVLLVRVTERTAVAPVGGQATISAPYVAALRMPNSDMQFSVAVSPERGDMTVVASGSYPALGAHSLELWWMSAKGPVPIGLLPTSGRGAMPLPSGLRGKPGEVRLAVSLEPQGGSPTGKPTGPVLDVARAIRVS